MSSTRSPAAGFRPPEPLVERLAQAATRSTGSTTAFLLAAVAVLVVTFLLVFVIQRSENKDTLAIHLKWNESIAAMEGASKQVVIVEDLSESEMQRLKEHSQRLAETIAAAQA